MSQPASQHTLRERLEGLACYLDVFLQPSFKNTYSWSVDNEARKQVDAFCRKAYDLGWVTPGIDWPKWSKTAAGQALCKQPELVATASVRDLECILTCYIRAERFGDGQLAEGFRNGVLIAMLQRMRELAEQESGGGSQQQGSTRV